MSGLILSIGQVLALSSIIALGICVLVVFTKRILKKGFGILVSAFSR